MAIHLQRFYTQVELVPAGEAALPLTLELDGESVLTPARRLLTIAHKKLGNAIAQEWAQQTAVIELAAMPMTRLTMSVNDHVAPRLDLVREEALAYGKTDLLCYRVAEPERLFERQTAIWQPYLDWAAEVLGARLKATADIKAIEHGQAALDALREAVRTCDPYRLLVLYALTTKYGSLVLALAVLRGRVDASEALAVSRLDEIFQAEIWGKDWDAERRSESIAAEVADLARFLSLLD